MDIQEWNIRVGERRDVGFPLFSPDDDTWKAVLERTITPSTGLQEEGIIFKGAQGKIWLRPTVAGTYRVSLTLQTVNGREPIVEFFVIAA